MLNVRQPCCFISLIILFLILFNFNLGRAQNNLKELFGKSKNAVVLIKTFGELGNPLAQGTGFFVDEKGHLITNRHVMVDAESSVVQLLSGEIFMVRGVVAEDKDGDLVELEADVRPKTFTHLKFSKDTVSVGDKILVVGNPLGLEGSLSDGIIASVRTVPNFGEIIQITAPISHGSSGSPVLNLKGQVIGVAAMYLEGGQNLNFAIPASRVLGLKVDTILSLRKWKSTNAAEGVAEAEKQYENGMRSIWAQDYSSAIGFFREAIRLSPTFRSARAWLAYALRQLNNYGEAISVDQQGALLEPDNWIYYYGMGLSYWGLNRYEEALTAYKKSISLRPDLADAYAGLGLTYLRLGMFDAAIEAGNKAIEIDPSNPQMYIVLGSIYQEKGDCSKSIEAFQRSIELRSDFELAYYGLGYCYGMLGRFQEAVTAYKSAIALKPDKIDTYWRLATTLTFIGRAEEAKPFLTEAIRNWPEHDTLHYALGMVYLALGDRKQALDEYSILKSLDQNLAKQLFGMIYK